MLTILQTEDMPFSFKLDNGIKKKLLCYRLKNKRGICNLWTLKSNVELIFLNIKCTIFTMA